jgi:1-deoxyxylulose-5-phosphate synthase
MRSGKVIAVVAALTTLVGCAGQASYSTMQYLASARNGCAAGDPFLCGEAARWEAQAAQEAQQDANVKTAVAGVGVAAILGVVALGLASQFAHALAVSERHGWNRFVSMQNLVNLLYREEEREMLPLCAADGIGVIPWSPQARGRLTRDWSIASTRSETDESLTRLFAKTEEADRKVVDRVAEVAVARGISRAQVALAWLLSKPVITAPIVGATKLSQLDEAMASVQVKLSDEEIASLEAPYVPHAVVGFT